MKASTETPLYAIEIDVPYVESDPNNLFRMAWRGRKSKYDAIKNSIAHLTIGKRPAAPLEKFKISITRRASKYLDYDNLIASFKPVLDALIMAKIIKDDNWGLIKHIDVDQVATKKGVRKSLLVKVEEV